MMERTTAWTAAALVGMSLPLIVFGRGVTQGILAVALVAAALHFVLTHQRPLDPKTLPALRLGAIVAVAWIPSVLLSWNHVASATTWGRTIAMALGVLLLWSLLHRQTSLQRVAFAALLLTAAVAVPFAGVKAWLLGADAPAVRALKPAASAVVILIPVLLLAAHRLGGRWWWCACLVVVASIPMVVLGTGSRSALAGLGVSLAVVLGLVALRYRRYYLIAAGLACGAAIIGLVGPSEKLYVGYTYDLYLPKTVDAHRQLIWRFTFDKFLERPVFGWGLNVINETPGAGDNIPGMNQEYIPSHPHNWLVEVASETGAVGFVALVGALGVAAFRLASDYLRCGAAAPLAAITTLIAFWVSAAFNFSIWATWWELILLVSMALTTSGRGKLGAPTVSAAPGQPAS